MRVVALISGGKDSCYNMMQCVIEGHDIVALANLKPLDKDDLDSFMYQTVGHNVLDLYSQAIGLPLYQKTTTGNSLCQDAKYRMAQGDEVEDLYLLLANIMKHIEFDAVASGAVLSNYQRDRIENVCSRLGLKSLAYLWQREQKELLEEMITCNLEAMIVKVAALGLDPRKHLGKSISEMQPLLWKLNEDYGIHVCGEGGEYETLTLDCPAFTRRIVIDRSEIVRETDNIIAPSGYLRILEMHLENKGIDTSLPLAERLRGANMRKRRITLHRTYPSFTSASERNYTIVQDGHVDTLAPKVVSSSLGRYLAVSGMHCTEEETQDISVYEETKLTMDRIKDNVSAQEALMSDIVLTNICLRDMNDFSTINQAYQEYIDFAPPARVCVGAALRGKARVMIDCLAYRSSLPNQQGDRKNLYVQSISHWAPANIGPYSQAVMVDKCCFFSGSIGLDPPTMTLVDGTAPAEAPLSLHHVLSVQSVIHPGASLENLTFLLCYTTSQEALHYADQEYRSIQKINPNLPFIGVVVPSLPRSASVEWQAGAHELSCIKREGHEWSVTLYGLEIYGAAQAIHCKGAYLSLSFVPCIGWNEMPQSSLCKTIVDQLKRAALSLHVAAEQLLVLRLFVKESSFSSVISFKNALLSFWSAGFQIIPAVIIVPATSLRQDAVVSLFAHFAPDPRGEKMETEAFEES